VAVLRAGNKQSGAVGAPCVSNGGGEVADLGAEGKNRARRAAFRAALGLRRARVVAACRRMISWVGPDNSAQIGTLCIRREWSSLKNFGQMGRGLLERVRIAGPGIPGEGSESDAQLVAVVP
jgi:hypothetical protein